MNCPVNCATSVSPLAAVKICSPSTANVSRYVRCGDVISNRPSCVALPVPLETTSTTFGATGVALTVVPTQYPVNGTNSAADTRETGIPRTSRPTQTSRRIDMRSSFRDLSRRSLGGGGGGNSMLLQRDVERGAAHRLHVLRDGSSRR